MLNIFSYAYWLFDIFFGKKFVQILCPFWVRLLFSYSVAGVLSVFCIQIPYHVYDFKYSLPFWFCFSASLMVSFTAQWFLILMNPFYLRFFFVISDLSFLRGSCLMNFKIFLFFSLRVLYFYLLHLVIWTILSWFLCTMNEVLKFPNLYFSFGYKVVLVPLVEKTFLFYWSALAHLSKSRWP